jgi:hypothetical protein
MKYNSIAYPISKEKQIVDVLENLSKHVSVLSSKVNNAGYAQRNALISHVNSAYNNREELLIKKDKWERLVFELNIHQELADYLTPFKDIYGCFPDYEKMIAAFDALIKHSAKEEEYEIAIILKRWRDQLPNP